MKKLLIAIGGRELPFNWLITDIDSCCQNVELLQEYRQNEYLFLSNDELLDILEQENFQWIWGLFFAIPKKYSKSQILQAIKQIPLLNNSNEIWDCKVIHHPFAEIEILAEDSSSLQIIAKDDKYADLFYKAYPLAEEIKFDVKCE